MENTPKTTIKLPGFDDVQKVKKELTDDYGNPLPDGFADDKWVVVLYNNHMYRREGHGFNHIDEVSEFIASELNKIVHDNTFRSLEGVLYKGAQVGISIKPQVGFKVDLDVIPSSPIEYKVEEINKESGVDSDDDFKEFLKQQGLQIVEGKDLQMLEEEKLLSEIKIMTAISIESQTIFSMTEGLYNVKLPSREYMIHGLDAVGFTCLSVYDDVAVEGIDPFIMSGFVAKEEFNVIILFSENEDGAVIHRVMRSGYHMCRVGEVVHDTEFVD